MDRWTRGLRALNGKTAFYPLGLWGAEAFGGADPNLQRGQDSCPNKKKTVFCSV
jgi:hypothetical protein